MINTNCFTIEGKYTLIFRREPLFSGVGEWIVFDPEGLEFYGMNTIAAEFFFLISQGKSDAESYDMFKNKYSITFEQYNKFKKTLIESSPFYESIIINNILNNLYNNEVKNEQRDKQKLK